MPKRSAMRPEYGINPYPKGGPRSTFNVSETHKTTFNANFLIPIYWDYLYPGEVRKGKVNAFVRLSNPLEFPIMDNIYLTIHWFSDSIRNMWTNFRKFYGERTDPADSISYTVLELGTGSVDLTTGGSEPFRDLCDYLGLPHVTSFDQSDASALPFRMYNRVFNYWYRDQQVDDSLTENVGDGPDGGSTDYVLKERRKRFDYFTNITIAPQRGDSVTIGGEISTDLSTAGTPSVYSTTAAAWRRLDSDAANVDVSATVSNQASALYPNTTINELRNAVAIQQFLEKDNRHGTRFGELIYGHWGTEFQDARFNPVYIAGGTAPVNVTPVMNQSNATATEALDLGDLGAIGSGAMNGSGSFTYAAHEPEIIMCIANVWADQTYHQGLNRKWSYRTRYDFMWPEFQGIGDQSLLLKEIYYQNNSNDENVFGYSPRYEECRIGINRLSGEFRPDNTASIDTWHLAEDFVGAPSYNSTFIDMAVPMGRVLQSTVPNHIIADFEIQQFSTKQLSMSGIPGLARL